MPSVHLHLLIRQQRRSLPVLAHNRTPTEHVLTAHESGQCDNSRTDEEDSANGEGEDPLELEDGHFCEELADTRR